MRYLLLIGIFANLYAQSYEDYVEMLRHDPSVVKINHQSSAYHAKAEQSLALSNPQLVFGVDNMPVENPSFNAYLPTAKVIGFNQKFSNARSESAEVNILTSTQEDLRAKYQYKLLEVGFYTALVERELIQKQLENFIKEKTIFQEITEIFVSELESGKDVSAKISKIDERTLVLLSEISEAKTTLHVKNNALKRYVQEIPDIDFPIKTLKPYKIETLFPIALAQSQNGISSAKHKEAEAKDGVDFTLQFLYKQREESDSFSGEDWVTLRGVMNLPVWGSTDAQKRVALQMQSASKYEYENQRNLWQERMDNYALRYENLQERIALHVRHQRRIEKTYNAQERTYSSGRGSYALILESKLRQLENHNHILNLKTQQLKIAAEQNAQIME